VNNVDLTTAVNV